MSECNPDMLDHHPMVTTKLDRLKESLYTNRAALKDWFQALAHSRQHSPETSPPFPVNLELNRTGQLANWKACQFGFVVKECVTRLLQQAKRRVPMLPRLEPEEGYGTGFILSVHFTEKLLEDFPYYKFYCASKLREKHPDLVMVRRDYYATQRQMLNNPLIGRSPHPLLLGQPMEEFVMPPPSGGGGAVSGVVRRREEETTVSPVKKPSQSQLAKRLLWYECESKNLRCAICLESESLLPGSCVMFMCSHYVCELCYPSVEGKRCPLCRKEIKVSVDEGC
jgi:hypothetical protein